MEVAKQRELIEALLACPSLDSQKRRDAVIGDLRERIQSNIERSAADRDDVAAIVRTCLQFPNGLEELVAAVRVRDQGSFPMQNLDRLILRLFGFDLAQEDAGLRLLVILGGIQAAPDDLQRAYQRLLPSGVMPPPETTGLFSMLPHLWRVSRELSAQGRGASVPLLDFVEQLARDASGSVAGQLRAWATEMTPFLLLAGPVSSVGDARPFGGTGTGDGGAGLLEPRLAILATVLAALYPTVEASGELVAAARLNPVGIEFRELPAANWQNILASAARRGRVGNLIEAALADQPQNAWLKVAQAEEEQARTARLRPVSAPEGYDQSSTVKLDAAPAWPQHVGFLQEGLSRARSVVLVQTASAGSSTGFLVRGDLVLVPGYVIRNIDEARQATIRCNFERTMGELITTPEELQLMPDEGFATTEDQLWTAVRVSGKPTERWGYLELAPATPCVNDRVSLIHHTGGGPKQLEVLSRIVLEVNEASLQYVTDPPKYDTKQPGAGGGPIFDLNWRVIGVHRAHGWLKSLSNPSSDPYFRGEGVRIDVIIQGLKAAGLYVGKEAQ